MIQKYKKSDHHIRAVIYDFDGTFYYARRLRIWLLIKLIKSAISSPIQTYRALRIIQTYRNILEEIRYDEKVLSSTVEEHIHMKLTARKLKSTIDTVEPIITEWMEKQASNMIPHCIRKKTLQFIQRMHESQIKQGIYSDYPAIEKLKSIQMANHFHAVVWSGEQSVLSYKPSPKGFLKTAELLDCPPDEILYIGDRAEVDGQGAHQAGMHFTHVKKLTASIIALAKSDPQLCLNQLAGLAE